MIKRFRIFYAVLIGLIFLTDAVGYRPYLSPERATLNAPVGYLPSARSFLAAGEAWTPGSLPPVEIRAFHPATGTVIAFPGTRNAIRNRGEVVEELAAFTAAITLPEDGAWELRAVMRGSSASPREEIASAPRRISVSAKAAPRSFAAFDPGHLIAIALLIAAAAALILRYRLPCPENELRFVSLALGSAMLTVELLYHLYFVAIGAFTPTAYLMLQMCGISILIVPFVLVMDPSKLRQRLFELSWFWGLGGAFQAYLAPNLATHPFPEPRFFSYFFEHGLLILAPIFLALSAGLRPSLKSVLRVFGISVAAGAAAWGIDQMFRLIPPYEPANYFMMGYPPPQGSVIDRFSDAFGPSPAYGIGLALMCAALFLILYLPFPIIRAIKSLKPEAAA
jgi:hypothetical integral membrane protein (TIGR02206 family)